MAQISRPQGVVYN